VRENLAAPGNLISALPLIPIEIELLCYGAKLDRPDAAKIRGFVIRIADELAIEPFDLLFIAGHEVADRRCR
jgi:hypothetical protein